MSRSPLPTNLPGVLALSLCLTSCAVSLESSRRPLAPSPGAFGAAPEPSPHCKGLDRDRSNWAAVAAGAALLTSSAGIATIPVGDDQGRIALASASVGGAVLGAVALALQHAATEAWSRDCAPLPVSPVPSPRPPVSAAPAPLPPVPPSSSSSSTWAPFPLPPASGSPAPAPSSSARRPG
jgi:hypothetical protein